ncbi:hypothetical protein N0V85_001911 [Neurospora sp. IMI 360204]|nr:hypothetical protein N0V85_001911 [Neurospora sp. IMI 360204]
MDIYRAYELHFRLSKEVDDLEKELEAEKQNASRELQKAKDELEDRRLEERLMLQKSLGNIPPNLGQFIEDKREFYLRQATQEYEERLETDRKRFVEMISAVNEKWRTLPFDIEHTSTPHTELPLSLGTQAPELSNGTMTPGMLIPMPFPPQRPPPPTQLAPKAQPAMKLPVSNPSNLLPKPQTAVPAASVQKALPASSTPKRPITETQSPNEIIANEQQPAKRSSTKRSITFAEVYQDGNAKFKHIIVEYPPESGEFYILKCDDHGVHFGANPLAGAAKHLASRMHDHQSKNYSVAIDSLGFRVIGCNAELARKNNTAVEEAAVNGYRPVNLLQLSVGKRARYVEANPEFANSFPTPIPPLASPAAEALVPAMAPPSLQETASPAMAPPPLRDPSTPSPAKDRRKSLHVRTPSDRSTRSAVLIPDPNPARLYKGFWVQDKRHYPVMVLPVEEADLSSVGLQKTLEDTKLLQNVPLCYKLGKTAGGKIKFEGWAPGYEDGGPLVKLRQVPVMYFDRDMSFGWLSIKDISAFDFDDPDWRQIPYFQKAVEHWESLNKVGASGETPGGAQEPRLEPIPATLSEPARNPAAPAAAAAPTASMAPAASMTPTASVAPTASTEPTAASSRPQSVPAAVPQPTQKPAIPAAAAAPKPAPPRPQPVSAAVSKPPAAVPVLAAVPKSPAAVVTPPTATAAPTMSKPVAPSTVSVPVQSGPNGIPPAVVRLAEIAKTDPQLRALIERVGSKQGTKEENERLESIVDRIALELSSSGEAVAATVQLLQPNSVNSDPKNTTARAEASGAPASRPPSLAVPSLKEGKKGQGTGLKSPESSKPPTPQLTRATIPPGAAPSPLVTAGPTPDSSKASSRTTSPTEAPISTATNNLPAKPATFVKPENGVTATPPTTKTTQPQNEKFEVSIEKGSWNVETKCPMEDNLSVRLIACNQTKIASTAPGMAYKYCPYKFEIDPNNFASVVVENCPSNPNAKTIVTMILKKEREGSGDRTVVLTFDRFVNPDTRAVESGRVQARRFCRWLRGVNTSMAYSNKRLVV